MADTLKVGALAMRAVLLTIAQGMDVQRSAGNGFSSRADKAVSAGLARQVRGHRNIYQLTDEGRALLRSTGGSER